MNLDDLEVCLNSTRTQEGNTFDAFKVNQDVLEVICSNNTEFPVRLVQTETQLLAVTRLFKRDEIKAGMEPELNNDMLIMSPVIPLSSLGVQGSDYILFGSMALGTKEENIVHEIEVQAENTLQVLDAVQDYLV